LNFYTSSLCIIFKKSKTEVSQTLESIVESFLLIESFWKLIHMVKL
jgi:hypothetical protein